MQPPRGSWGCCRAQKGLSQWGMFCARGPLSHDLCCSQDTCHHWYHLSVGAEVSLLRRWRGGGAPRLPQSLGPAHSSGSPPRAWGFQPTYSGSPLLHEMLYPAPTAPITVPGSGPLTLSQWPTPDPAAGRSACTPTGLPWLPVPCLGALKMPGRMGHGDGSLINSPVSRWGGRKPDTGGRLLSPTPPSREADATPRPS